MTEFSLVQVDLQPDFSDFSLVPVDYDPFSTDGATQQAQVLAESQPQQPATGIGQSNVGAPASNSAR